MDEVMELDRSLTALSTKGFKCNLPKLLGFGALEEVKEEEEEAEGGAAF